MISYKIMAFFFRSIWGESTYVRDYESYIQVVVHEELTLRKLRMKILVMEKIFGKSMSIRVLIISNTEIQLIIGCEEEVRKVSAPGDLVMDLW